MTPKSECPLTSALLLLLQACVDLETTSARRLAGDLCKSPQTVQTDFRRICELLGVHGRGEALLMALKRGWIKLPPAFPPRSPPLKMLSIVGRRQRSNSDIIRQFHRTACLLGPDLEAM